MKILISIFIIFLFSTTSLAIDLQDANLKQLVNQRPDLVEDIKAGKDEGTSIISVVKDVQRRMKTWTEKRKNLDNVVVSKRIDKYTYYLTGEVNEIVQEKYEGIKLTLTSKQKIKHYRDGTQPDMISMNIEISKKL